MITSIAGSIEHIDPWRLIAALRSANMVKSQPQRAKVAGHSTRKPKHPINLTDDERDELLRRVSRLMSPYFVVLHATIVLPVDDGLPTAVIAERLGVARNTVRHWRARFERRRLAGLEPLPKPGRAARRGPRRARAAGGDRGRGCRCGEPAGQVQPTSTASPGPPGAIGTSTSSTPRRATGARRAFRRRLQAKVSVGGRGDMRAVVLLVQSA